MECLLFYIIYPFEFGVESIAQHESLAYRRVRENFAAGTVRVDLIGQSFKSAQRISKSNSFAK